MPFYKLVNDPAYELPAGVSISKMYIVSSLEIALDDELETYLALRLHSYPTNTSISGYWAPPNLQHEVNKGWEPSQKTQGIIEELKGHLTSDEQSSMLKSLKLLAESFGLRGAEPFQLPEEQIIEFKSSINNPTLTNAFLTVRYGMNQLLKEGSEGNLIDREGRHGFVLLPLSDASRETQLTKRIDPGTGLSTSHFLGKPLISGLQHILEDRVRVNDISGRAINVKKVESKLKQEGLIAVADVEGYGRVLASEYNGIISNPADERSVYQARVLNALEVALTASGTSQVQTAGDGFVAGYPVASKTDLHEMLLNVVAKWTNTVDIIDGVNRGLQDAQNANRIGSRLALNYGKYEWGRINGLTSFMPAFNGPSVVDAARLEQGLNKYMTSYGNKADGHKRPHMHSLVLSASLVALLKSPTRLIDDFGWEYQGAISLEGKEEPIPDVHLFFRPPAP